MTIKQNRTPNLECKHCHTDIAIGDLKDNQRRGKALCLDCSSEHFPKVKFADLNRPGAVTLSPKPVYIGARP